MTFIKKLSMKGFKSFARETGINMDRHMNVIVGPNGSGKSNLLNVLRFLKDATTSPADESRGVTGFEDAVFKLGGPKY